MTQVVVLIPVLNRPHHAARVLASLRASESGCSTSALFLCSPGDDAEIAAVRATGADYAVVDWAAGPGDYSRKMNFGYRRAVAAGADYAFLAADDVVFHPGWADRAVAAHVRTRACVVGTNDLANRRVQAGVHSTHTLVHRDYGECGTADEPDSGKILCELYDHNFCNPPEAPIWMADCSFRALGDVKPGDRVIGWTNASPDRPAVGAPLRTLCYSEVLSTARRSAPLVRVVMASGREFRCSPDHRWLNATWTPSLERKARSYAEWVTPEVGRTLLHVIDEPAPLPTDVSPRLAGWLAGIHDGEGSGIVIASQSVTANPEVDAEIQRVLDRLAVNYRRSVSASGVASYVMNGGRQGYLDFLLRVLPVNRKPLEALIVGWRPRESSRTERQPIGARRFGHRDRIVAVEPAGEGEVRSLTTSSGNYVAWGYASRNCDDEFVQTAMWRRTWAFARDSRVEHLHPDWGTAELDETYRKGKALFHEDARLYASRQRLWNYGR